MYSKGISIFLKSISLLLLLCIGIAINAQESDKRNERVTTTNGGRWISGGIYAGYSAIGQYGASTLLTVTAGQTTISGSIGFVPPLLTSVVNNAPIAIVPDFETYYTEGDEIVLDGFDPDGDEIEFILTGNPELGTIEASTLEVGVYKFTPSGSLLPKNGYQDTIRFKVKEAEGTLESEIKAYAFTFNVQDKPHVIDAFEVSSSSADDMTLGLSIKDPQFNSSYKIKLSYIDLSVPTAPSVIAVIDQDFPLASLTVNDDILTASINASKVQFPYLFNSSQVFVTVDVSVNSGFADDDAFILRNSANGTSSGGALNEDALGDLYTSITDKGSLPLVSQASSDGQFFTFATSKSTPENSNVELNLYAIELGSFDLSTATLGISTNPKVGTNSTPAKVKSTTNLAQWTVNYTPTGEKGYLDSLEFSVLNIGRDFTSKAYALVEVIDVNDPPQLKTVANQQINEDATLSLDLEGNDVDNSLSYVATSSDGTNIPVTVNGNRLIITPKADYNGRANITVQANEVGTTEAYKVFKTFEVNVLPVNDKPILASIDDKTINEDNPLTINFSTSDVDSRLAVFSYNTSADVFGVLNISINGNTMQIEPKKDFNGVVNLSITADDRLGTLESVSDSKTFKITINGVNDVPEIEQAIPAQNVLKGFPTYTLSLGSFFKDVETPDGQLTYTIDNSALFMLSESNGVLSVSTKDVAAGTEVVNITASDGVATVTQAVTFTLDELSADVQVANAIEDRIESEDFGQVQIDLSALFTDVNNNAAEFTYEVSGSSSIPAQIAADGKTLILTSPSNFSGSDQFFIIGKSGGKSAFAQFNVTVNAVNDAPTLNTVQNQTTQEDTELTGIVTQFADIDTDLNGLTFTATSSNQALVKDASIALNSTVNGVEVSLNPEENASGNSNITLNVSDGQYTASRTFKVSVESVNDKPTVASSTLTNATEDLIYSVDLKTLFNDIDNDPLTFSLENKPSWLTLTGSTLSGTPLNGNVGTATFFITANDGGGGTVRQSYTVITSNVNDAPILATALPNITATEDVLLSSLLNIASFSDVDRDALTYTATFTGNTWLSFDRATNRFTGTPTNNDIGVVTVTVTATDGSGTSATGSFTLTIANVNDAPSDISLANLSIAENSTAVAILSAISSVDVDAGDSHSYSFVSGTGSDDNDSFTINGTNLLTAASFNFESKATLKFRIKSTDAQGGSLEKAFVVNISDVNESPTALNLSALTIAENNNAGASIGTLSTTDPDNDDSHTYAFSSGTGDTDNGSFEISSGSLVAKNVLNLEEKASYSVLVTSTDANGLSFTQNFTIAVSNVNEAPSNVSLSNLSVLENEDAGAVVGNLSSTDEDNSDTHTYALISGTGDQDNAAFSISNNQLVTSQTFDREAKAVYSVRISTTDAGGLSTEKTFTIDITNVAEAALAVDSDDELDFGEVDLASSKTLTFSVSNDGDADGLQVTSISAPEGFSIDKNSFTLASGNSETITVTFTPSEGKSYTGQITISSSAGNETINIVGIGTIVTSIDDDIVDENEVNLYPNPSTEWVTIDLTSAPLMIPNVSIIDMNGLTIWSKTKVASRRLNVNVSNYPAGTYIVKVASEKGIVLKKLIVIK
ncbi:MAG: hypothetical protein ACJAXB_000247 [Candidatus Endobugula sp.]|jgi:hypothetical protein